MDFNQLPNEIIKLILLNSGNIDEWPLPLHGVYITMIKFLT